MLSTAPAQLVGVAGLAAAALGLVAAWCRGRGLLVRGASAA